MDVAEILGRLNAKIPGMEGQPGYGTLTVSDIAGGLAGLPRPSQLVLLARYSQHAGLEQDIIYYTLNYTARLWANRGWAYPREQGPDWLRKLSKLAVIELVYPLPCRRCNGKKRVTRWATRERVSGYSILCPRCTGSGTHNLSEREKAEIVGLSHSAWKAYQLKYKTILDHIAVDWEHIGLAHLKRQLQG